ncbi:hypothetical protein [Burkholderia latens]|uniref:hypothetical protein n=1 Tax=Burkholderia latens TaxID=488446 RepID=UPI001FC8A0DF|nr:hypothetical protein [Burkholderia latens]
MRENAAGIAANVPLDLVGRAGAEFMSEQLQQNRRHLCVFGRLVGTVRRRHQAHDRCRGLPYAGPLRHDGRGHFHVVGDPPGARVHGAKPEQQRFGPCEQQMVAVEMKERMRALRVGIVEHVGRHLHTGRRRQQPSAGRHERQLIAGAHGQQTIGEVERLDHVRGLGQRETRTQKDDNRPLFTSIHLPSPRILLPTSLKCAFI